MSKANWEDRSWFCGVKPTKLATVASSLHRPCPPCQTSDSPKKLSGQTSSLSKKKRRQHAAEWVAINAQGFTQLSLHRPCRFSYIHWNCIQQRPLKSVAWSIPSVSIYHTFALWRLSRLVAAGTMVPFKGQRLMRVMSQSSQFTPCWFYFSLLSLWFSRISPPPPSLSLPSLSQVISINVPL